MEARQVSFEDILSSPIPTPSYPIKKTVKKTPPKIVQFPSGIYTPVIKPRTRPITDKNEQLRIREALLKSSPKPHLAYRNYLIWIVGCNIGRRAGDLLTLRLGDVIEFTTFKVKEQIAIVEQKTGKVTSFYFAPSVEQAIQEYFDNLPSHLKSPWEPLFPSQKRAPKTTSTQEIKVKSENKTYIRTTNGCLDTHSYNRILRELNKKYHLTEKLSSHCMRKTAARTAYDIGEATKAQTGIGGLELAQSTVTYHTNSKTTLDYIGITEDIKKQVYRTEIL